MDNILLDKKNSLNNNSKNDNNDISLFGRKNFAREPMELNKEDFQIIEIMDIRKNEYFGDIHMFLEQRSPFTIKTKTRIAEILFLRKNDALNISRNFPNICRRIQNKSYHTLVSIKKRTFSMLRQHYDNYLFNKKRKSIRLDLSAIKKSKFLGEKKEEKNNFNSAAPDHNNLLVYTKKSDNTKNNDNSLIKESNCIDKSKNLNSIYNSELELTNITIKKAKKKSKKDIIKYQKDKSLKNNTGDSFKKNKIKNDKKELKHSFFYPKNYLSIHKMKTKNLKDKSSLNNKKEEEEKDDDEGKYFQYDTGAEKMNNNNSFKEFLTLKTNNGNIFKKIKSQLHKKRKIQKFIKYLNKKKYKIDKNLVELYLQQNSIERKSSNKILIINKLKNINSRTSSKNKILSKNLNSSESEINSYANKNMKIFNKKELYISTEFFEIKSSYKNMNILSKGKMINDTKYQIFIQNIFTNFIKEDNSKKINSLLAKKEINEAEKKIIKNNEYYSDAKLPFISQNKNNVCYNNLQTTENLNSINELKSSKKIKNSKFFEEENFKKLKLNNIGLYKKKENINIKNDNSVVNNIKIYSIRKTLFKSKKTNKPKKEGKSNNIENFLNKLDELNKNNILKYSQLYNYFMYLYKFNQFYIINIFY